MEIQDVLAEFGLKKRETAIYLACLENGPQTVASLTTITGQKRSTINYTVSDLVDAGLLRLGRRGKRVLYDAERPKKLLQILQKKQSLLEQHLPALDALRQQGQPDVQTRMYEGQTAIHRLYEEIYDYIGPEYDVWFLGMISDLQSRAPAALDLFLRKIRETPSYRVRELLWDNAQGVQWMRSIRKEGLTHPCRFMSAEYPIANDLVFFHNKVAIFSFGKRASAIVIEDINIVKTLKALYEWTWASARELD